VTPKLSERGEQRRAELVERIEELSDMISAAADEIDAWEAELEELGRELQSLEEDELLELEACRLDRRQIPLPLEQFPDNAAP
jgi:hypothetical protein